MRGKFQQELQKEGTKAAEAGQLMTPQRRHQKFLTCSCSFTTFRQRRGQRQVNDGWYEKCNSPACAQVCPAIA